MRTQPFKIQTLSDFTRLGIDPATVLTVGAAAMTELFPNLFNTRTPMTKSKLDQIFPGSGYWTVQLKNYLLEHTQWTVDMRFWYPFENQAGYIKDFAYMHYKTYCPECANFGVEAWPKFQKLLQQEQTPGGSPGGVFPGYESDVPVMQYVLFGGIALTLILLSKKKKR